MKARIPQGAGGAGNMNQMMQRMQKMQEEMTRAQAELEEKVYHVSAGGGTIEVEINGKKEITAVTLKPEVVDPDDIEFLQDLIREGVNEAIRAVLPELLKNFQIIHLCGKGKMDDSLKDTKGYVQFEYIKEELRDLMAAADIMISRAGANAICEILALRKPNILIPLSAQASRGDQILNAASFEKQGYSIVIQEEDLTNEKLLNAVNTAFNEKERFIKAMQRSQLNNSIEKIVELINVSAKNKKK